MSMSPKDAWLYAASWGSYIRAGDPGACMYGFNENFHVQSEDHRAACLKYISDCRLQVEANPDHYEPDELEQMDAFVAALKAAPAAQRAA